MLGTNRLLNGPQGYDPDGLLTMKIVLPDRTYATDAARRQFVTRSARLVRDHCRRRDGGRRQQHSRRRRQSSRAIEIDGHPAADPKVADQRRLAPDHRDYFSTMRMPIREGRAFTIADREDSAPVAIVSESMARKFWPGEDPIGRRVQGEGRSVADGRRRLRRRHPRLVRPAQRADACTAVRAGAKRRIRVRRPNDGRPGGRWPAPIRQALLAIDPNQPVFDLMTMRTAIKERTIGLQYLAAMMTVFAALALVLAVVGLYAVMAYLVAQRTHEIGVRIALGAAPTDVVRLTVGQALRLTIVGSGDRPGALDRAGRLMEAGMLGIASSDARVSVLFARCWSARRCSRAISPPAAPRPSIRSSRCGPSDSIVCTAFGAARMMSLWTRAEPCYELRAVIYASRSLRRVSSGRR